MIIGTAGHIDHGKTALVHALTGVNTDRLPEERKRGITIELGFAPLRLDSGEVISIVDVPGHEGLVRTMVAGASGIDAALVVVAADEGVMPQTREHLRVLSALNVCAGLVVLTKCDLVDDEWMPLVIDDVRSALAGSSLSAAPVVPASARTGLGIASLRSALASLSKVRPPHPPGDLFRFVVDRAFTLKGTGTVVTGTVWSGRLDVGAQVRLYPGGAVSRVRAIHSHGQLMHAAEPGNRFALALADVSPGAVPHGTQIVNGAAWAETRVICADIRVGGGGRSQRGSDRDLLLYVAGSEVRARISRLAPNADPLANPDPLANAVPQSAAPSGERVRIVLDRPVLTRRGDRFVLRTASPLDTVGGGTVVDPMPERGARGAWHAVDTSPTARLQHLLQAGDVTGVSSAFLPVRLGIAPAAVAPTVSAAGGVLLGPVAVSSAALDRLLQSVQTRLSEWRASNPLEGGYPLARLREEIACAASAVDHVVERLCAGGRYAVTDGLVQVRNEQPSLSQFDTDLLARLLRLICDADVQPPSVQEIVGQFGSRAESLLRFAARRGNLIPVESVRYYDAGVTSKQIGRMREVMQPGREYAPQELRDILGVSRKYLIPFLEYCDRTEVTERRSSGRVINGVTSR
ncbi:MAG: selenocysteine-specific translation elongation factor [Gemmatimonadaceae bacterium]